MPFAVKCKAKITVMNTASTLNKKKKKDMTAIHARDQKLTSPVLMLYLKSLIAGLFAPVSGAKVEFQGVTAGAKIPTPMTSFSNPVPSKSENFYFQKMTTLKSLISAEF